VGFKKEAQISEEFQRRIFFFLHFGEDFIECSELTRYLLDETGTSKDSYFLFAQNKRITFNVLNTVGKRQTSNVWASTPSPRPADSPKGV
jgi:hypothetical protein